MKGLIKQKSLKSVMILKKNKFQSSSSYPLT